MDSVQRIVEELLRAFGASYDSIETTEVAGQKIISIRTQDARALIGNRGDAVHALDLLVKKIYEKRYPAQMGEGTALFLVDVNDYRSKQIKELQTKALMLAERARSFRYDVELSPMSAYERLIVHTTLQGAPNVKTESQGEGRNRRVVIKYSAQ